MIPQKFIFIFVLICSSNVISQGKIESDIPWEKDEIKVSSKAENSSPLYLFNSIGKNSIKMYQNKIAVKSTSRCPYHISCSNYALKALEKYNFYYAFLLFIDRNLYREHFSAYGYYNYIIYEDNRLKLDDTFFLYEE